MKLLHEFAKEKVVNFIAFMADTFGEAMVEGAMAKVVPMPAISVLVMLDFLTPCLDAIKQKDLDKLGDKFDLFDVKKLAPVFSTATPEQQQKFWRYMDCFADCATNSEESN